MFPACPYANLCTAGAAGYSPSRCYPATCKSPAPDTVCTLESTPVICGDSKYVDVSANHYYIDLALLLFGV